MERGTVNPLTLAVLAEIVLHHENGASNTLVDTEEYYMDQRRAPSLWSPCFPSLAALASRQTFSPWKAASCLLLC